MDKEALKKAMLQAQSLQHDLIHAQGDLAKQVLEGKSNDGKVKVTMSAYGDFRKVEVDPSALVEGIPKLEKDILEALNSVTKVAADLTKTKLEGISKQIGL